MKRKTAPLPLAGVAMLALSLSACGGGAPTTAGGAQFNDGVTKIVNPSDRKGGTLRLAHSDDWDSIDPGNTYYAFSWNFARLYTRQLMTFKPAPGKEGLELVPDLATGPGEVSADGKTWTYHLRQGVKFEDGTPVTSKDVKYAIQRTYAKEVLPNGPVYFADLIDNGGAEYEGPYKDKDPNKLGLRGIETPDDATIVFKLKNPFADFDYLVTNPQTSPVPPAKDTGAKYFEHPISTGPYKVDTYQPGKTFQLSKNPNWDASTDPVRKQLVDKIEVQLKAEANDVDNRLLSGALHLDVAGAGVQAAAQSRILTTPNYKKNADNPLAGFLRYVAISTKVAPLDNVHCRRAVLYAADRVSMQTAYGGPVGGGDIATTALPPNIGGYQKFDLYPAGADNHGDAAKAKEELTQCGQPNGFETNMAVRSDRPKEVAIAEALQQSLAKVGIKASIKQFPSGKFYSDFAGNTEYVHGRKLGLIVTGWAADWPTGYGFLQQIVDGDAIKKAGNSNLSELDNPEVNALFDQAAQTKDQVAREQLYGQIDRKVMEEAAILPVVYAKTLLYRHPDLTNVFVNPAFGGMYDYAGLGLRR